MTVFRHYKTVRDVEQQKPLIAGYCKIGYERIIQVPPYMFSKNFEICISLSGAGSKVYNQKACRFYVAKNYLKKNIQCKVSFYSPG